MTNSSPAAHRNIVPSEVGWQFVPQYYTFVNKQPDRLHCFYTKKSTFIHGTEGEEGKPCHGQQEIHQKITSIGFHDCKVFIHSVDAQSSADGGIIIQVIGEMSNHGDPWRKFVQTFFLAEQPNGYFVLNDIFRFLKEETVDSDDGEPAEEPVEPVESAREATPAPPPAVIPMPEPEPPTTVAEVALEPAATPTPEPEPIVVVTLSPQVTTNGIHTEEAPEKQVSAAPSPVLTPAPVVEKPKSPAPPAAVAAPVPVVAATPAVKPQPAPQQTWATLAAANPKKWGSAVAQESRGTSEVIPAAAPLPNNSQSPSATPARQQAGLSAVSASQGVTTPHCFIKGVVENISPANLSQQLTQRFGAVKDSDVVRSKACAFVEFFSVESAKKAIAASLGEGGVVVMSDNGQIKLTIETKKERGERPPSRPRGAPGGEGRGGMTGSFRGRGRGGNRGGGQK